jgi:hypothetical protein
LNNTTVCNALLESASSNMLDGTFRDPVVGYLEVMYDVDMKLRGAPLSSSG